MTPLDNYGLVTAKVEVLNAPPSSISDDTQPEGKIFQYLNMDVGSDGWADGRIANTIINFKAPASWVEVNTIDPSMVMMYRYHDEEWQLLETTLTGQDGDYYYYSSETPGFSTFMIVAKGARNDNSTESDNAIETENTTDKDDVTVAKPQDTKLVEVTEIAKETIPGFGILASIFGLLFAFYSRR